MTLARVSITLDNELLEKADEQARTDKLNRSQYLARALRAYIEGVGQISIIPSYDPDHTKIIQRMSELERENSQLKDMVIKAQRETIAALGGQPSIDPVPPTPKRSWWDRIRGC